MCLIDYGIKSISVLEFFVGIPSNGDYTIPFSGKYEEDFGGPLICLDKNQKPVFTGIASFNSLSTKEGQPGIYTNIFKNKEWIRKTTGIDIELNSV